MRTLRWGIILHLGGLFMTTTALVDVAAAHIAATGSEESMQRSIGLTKSEHFPLLLVSPLTSPSTVLLVRPYSLIRVILARAWLPDVASHRGSWLVTIHKMFRFVPRQSLALLSVARQRHTPSSTRAQQRRPLLQLYHSSR